MLDIVLAIGCGFAAGLAIAIAEQRRHIDTLRAHYQQLMEHLTGDDDDRAEVDFWKFESRN
jgi:hypothetical protein